MDDMGQEAGSGFIETTMGGRLTRRGFARRVAIAGVSVPAIGAFIAACGDDDDPTTGSDAPDQTEAPAGSDAPGETTAPDGTEAPAASGGTIRVAAQKPAGPLDPVAMVDLGAYGCVAQCFEYLCTLADEDIGPSLATEWTPNDDSTEWTFKLREGVKWQNGGDFTSADVVATMERIATDGDGLGGSIASGDVTAPDPLTVVFTLGQPERAACPTSCRSTTRNRPSRRPTTRSGPRSTAAPTAPVRGSSTRTTRPPVPRSSATRRGGVAPPRSTVPTGSSSPTSARWSPRCRAVRSMPSSSSRSSAATPCSTMTTSSRSSCARRPTARSG